MVYSGPIALGFARFAVSVGAHFDDLVLVARGTVRPVDAPYELPTGVRLSPLPDYGSLRRLGRLALAMPATVIGCWRALSSLDIVWVSGVQPGGLLMVLLALLRRRRVVLLIRQDTMEYFRNRLPSPRWRPLLGPLWLLDRAFRTLARRLPTTVVGAELARDYGGPRPNLLEFHVSLPGADRPSAVREQPVWSGVVELLTVGRLEPEKNPLLVPELLAELERRRPSGYRLTWAGEGRLSERLLEQARASGTSDRLRLAGFVPAGPELDELYRSAHALVHIALTEGVPQVLGEAMAAGIPIVATDVGGVREALDDGAAGLLVPPGDAVAIARALERLSADPALRERLVARGLELALGDTRSDEAGRVARFIAGDRSVASRPRSVSRSGEAT